MLKALFKKQFAEIFKGYFVKQKTGEARSRAGIAGYFLLFAFIMLCVCFMFFGLASAIGSVFCKVGLSWIYFSVMGTMTILMGTLGSVFNTFSGLYLPKDNELLLSMPISIKALLTARLSGTVGLSLLYGGCVWIPSCVVYFIFAKSIPVISVIYCILLLFVLTVFISVITCVLGFFVALLSKKIKNKGVISAIFTVLFLVVYYAVVFRLENLFKLIIKNGEAIGRGIKKWGNLLYQLGKAASGDTKGFLIFTAVSVLIAVICFYVLEKTFILIATMNTGEKKSAVKKAEAKQQSVKSAILKKELKRFTSCSVYMLNTGLGIILAPIAAIAVAIKYDSLEKVIAGIGQEIPILSEMLPVCIPLFICLIFAMNGTTAPSVSLEGKNLWIYKSLPISSAEILNAKLKMHVLVNTPSAVISVIIMGICFGFETELIIISAVLSFVFIQFIGTFGLMVGLKFPNFTWTTETTPVKQSLPCFLSLLAGFAVPVLAGVLYYFVCSKIKPLIYLCYACVILYVAAFYIKKYLMTKGAKVFDEL